MTSHHKHSFIATTGTSVLFILVTTLFFMWEIPNNLNRK